MTEYLWNTGCNINNSILNDKALIILDDISRKIDIYIYGEIKRELLTKIRNDLRDIISLILEVLNISNLVVI